jgi:hypothetical protein
LAAALLMGRRDAFCHGCGELHPISPKTIIFAAV